MESTKQFAVISPAEPTLLEKIAQVTDQLGRVSIQSEEDFGKAGTFVKVIGKVAKEIDDERRALVDPLNEAVKIINARFKERTQVLDNAKKTIQPMMDGWLREQERIRNEAIRLERQQREEEALRQAAELEAQGAPKAAELALVQGTKATAAEKTKLGTTSEYGVTTSATETWSGEEADKLAILKAVVEGRLPLDSVTISKSALNEYARNRKEEGVFDGIRIIRQLKAVAR